MASAASRLAELIKPLDPVAGALQGAVRDARTAAPEAVRNLLDGTWLGAPLHPALTDVPIGATTTAALLDVAAIASGKRSMHVAAGAAQTVAVLGALPAATTGLNDWGYLRGSTARVGTAHALLNTGALVLNCLALAARRRGRGQLLTAASLGVTSFAAHLGGELSFGRGVRVDHTAFESPGHDFVEVANEADVPADGVLAATAEGVDVVLARVGDRVCAIAATCTHLGGPLGEGSRTGDAVVCPWHGSRFDLCTGRVLSGPAVYPQPGYEVRVADGRISVRPAPAP